MTRPPVTFHNNARKRVVSLGVHIVDVLGRPVTDIPVGQGRRILDEIAMTAAGTAAGTSVDLAKLGADVIPMGVLGDDLLGDFLVMALERHRIDCSQLTRRPATRTSASILLVRPDGARPALHFPGANPLMSLQDVNLDLIAGADVLHVGGPDALGGFAARDLVEVLTHARRHGVITTMDMLSPCGADVWDRITPALPLVDYFLPNDDQVRNLTGEDGLDEAAAVTLRAGVGALVVSTGPSGATLYTRGARRDFPSLAQAVVDTTGCGDAVSAGIITGLLEGRTIEESVPLGMAAAALVAGGLGSDAGLTGRAQLDELLGSLL